MMLQLVINALVLNAAWLITVIPASQGMTWTGPAFSLLWLATHSVYYGKTRLADISLCLMAACFGYLADSLLVITGVMHFPDIAQQGSPSTVWMVALWVNLALTLNYSLHWLQGKYVLSALLGAGAAALAYFTGSKLGAIILDSGMQSLFFIALMWAIAMPLLVWLTQQLNQLQKRLTNPMDMDYEHC